MTRIHLLVRGFSAASLITLAALTASSSRAATTFVANITHDQEPPPSGTTPPTTSTGDPRPLSFGTGTFVLNDDQTALSMNAEIFNIDVTGTQTPDINDNLLSAHIHILTPPAATGGVRWGFFGAPDNDNNPDNLVVTPFATGVGGTFTSIWDAPEGNGGSSLTASLPDIMAGNSYINFHTTQFGGGEIRGQIAVIPEPGSIMLLAAGLPGLLVLRRKR